MKKVSYLLWLTPKLHTRLKMYCEENQLKIAELLRDYIKGLKLESEKQEKELVEE